MAIRTELTLRLQNTPGAVGRICQYLSEDRINILAMQLEHNGLMRLLVDNPLHAAELLRERKIQVDTREVIYTIVPNDAGVLGRTAKLLADAGVNVEYLYSTVVEGHTMAAVVVGVPDAVKASSLAGL
jgi:hypothetical protein